MAQTQVLNRNPPPLTCSRTPSTHIGSLELPFLLSWEIVFYPQVNSRSIHQAWQTAA